MFSQIIQDSLLKVLKVENAQPKVKAELLASFEELAHQITVDYILGELDKSDGLVFLGLLDKDTTGEEAIKFAQEKIPNLESKITKRLEEEINTINS